jgi:hypothetical protein
LITHQACHSPGSKAAFCGIRLPVSIPISKQVPLGATTPQTQWFVGGFFPVIASTIKYVLLEGCIMIIPSVAAFLTKSKLEIALAINFFLIRWE